MQNDLHSNGIIGNKAGMVGSEACPNQCLAISMNIAPALVLINPLEQGTAAYWKERGEENKRYGRCAGAYGFLQKRTKATDTVNFLREEKLCLKQLRTKQPFNVAPEHWIKNDSGRPI